MPHSPAEPALHVAETVPPVAPGRVIGDRYLIGSVIGEGGMGVVCAATHVHLGTPVAVKLIRSDLKHDPDSISRFLNEARTAAALKGEHIARVYDVGQLETGEPYLVMEHLEGLGLDAFLAERGPLAQAEAVDILLQACEGLAEAHAVALVHRDIKAANLFLSRRPDGQFTLKILDFGIAKRLVEGPHPGLTDSRGSVGSPFYMPPEQMLAPATIDQRADVWSLGVLLYELLTNEYPFAGESAVQVCANVLTAPTPALRALRPDVDPSIEAIVQRCLEKQAEARFSGVTELAEALRPFGSSAQAASVVAATEALSLAAPEDGAAIAEIEVPVESLEPGAPDRAHESATVESWAPVAVYEKRRSGRPGRAARGALATAVIAGLLFGGALSSFLWPEFFARHTAARERIAKLRLPWDPTLNPESTESTLERKIPPPDLWISATSSETRSAPAREIPAGLAPSDHPQTLSPERRAERYERWLREGGMVRLNGEWTAGQDAPTPLDTKDRGLP